MLELSCLLLSAVVCAATENSFPKEEKEKKKKKKRSAIEDGTMLGGETQHTETTSEHVPVPGLVCKFLSAVAFVSGKQ